MNALSAATYAIKGRGRFTPLVAAWRLPLAHSAVEVLAVVALSPLLLWAALWNGFPLIFYDTGAYMLQSFADRFVPERSPVFSLFLRYCGGGTSLWLIALLQALMVSFTMVETARAIAPRIFLGQLLAIGTGLVILTGLPWYVGQIEPDAFTPLVILTSYLLAFHARRLGWWRTAVLVGIGALSAAVHPSHLGLAAGLVLVLAVFRGITLPRRFSQWPRANLLLPLLSATLGLALVFAANFHFTRHVFVSRAGPVFMFARLLQDGVVQRQLDETCSYEHYGLCAYRSALPHRADKWLWGPGTLFVKLHRFLGTEKESERIVHDSLVHYPLWNLELALRDTLQQFTLFHTGDQIEPQQWILYPDFHAFIPDQMAAYSTARQQKGELDFTVINWVHVPFGWIALLLLTAAMVLALRRGDRRTAPLLVFIFLALLGNAVICGAFSNPHARYQSRLIWVPAFALALLFVDGGANPLRTGA